MEELLSLLDEVEGEPKQLRVTSIVGFSGLGKTTLAKAVYDSPHAKDKFCLCAWITADGSPETSNWMKEILRGVLQQVRPGDAMDVYGQHLEASLKEYLKDKR
jgi:ABC-type glutathione transport system ATPase component